MDNQVTASSEGAGTKLTDVIPFVWRDEEIMSLVSLAQR